jgi:glycosyltransferase involved in cell wall biosynthesis
MDLTERASGIKLESFARLPDFAGAPLYIVIPAFRAANTIVDVVRRCLSYADRVVVVDDACPERSGEVALAEFGHDHRVTVLQRPSNGGVGAAMKTGIEKALADGASIIVKIDADGQMDPAYLPTIREAFEHDPTLVCVKGNRFFDSSVLEVMPKARLFGNGVLSLLVKCASGYWNAIDPTNGYLAFNADLLKLLPWHTFDNTYFFEMSVLCEFGLKRLPILELEMPTIYTEAPSSLSISRVIRQFPPKLLRCTLKRLLLQYFVFDVNLGTVYSLIGSLLLLFSIVFGGYEWIDGIVTHTAKPIGTVMLAVLPFMMGFQLLLNALMYDVQFSQKTYHEVLVNTRRRSLGRSLVD